MRRLQGSWEGMAELYLEEEAEVSQMVERAWDSLGKCMENPRVGGFIYEARMVGALSHFQTVLRNKVSRATGSRVGQTSCDALKVERNFYPSPPSLSKKAASLAGRARQVVLTSF